MIYDITRPIYCDGGCGHYHEQKGCLEGHATPKGMPRRCPDYLDPEKADEWYEGWNDKEAI